MSVYVAYAMGACIPLSDRNRLVFALIIVCGYYNASPSPCWSVIRLLAVGRWRCSCANAANCEARGLDLKSVGIHYACGSSWPQLRRNART